MDDTYILLMSYYLSYILNLTLIKYHKIITEIMMRTFSLIK